jgi:hypothetical protein
MLAIKQQVGECIYFKTNQNKVLADSEFDTENGSLCFSQFCYLPQNREKQERPLGKYTKL